MLLDSLSLVSFCTFGIDVSNVIIILIYLFQSHITNREINMSTVRAFTPRDFCSIVESNDIARCRAFLLPLSKKDISALVNTNLGSILHPKTPVHFAADEGVDIAIWKMIVPWAYETTVCKGPKPPLFRLLYKYSEKQKGRPQNWSRMSCTLCRHQLEKLRWWLEHTKLSTSKVVQYCKTDMLWRLCRIQGSADPAKASLEEVRNLAKDMIETYNTSICLEATVCPIHFAMETDNICFLSLFLSYETANANCLLDDWTPLLTSYSYRKQSFYLPCIGLLIENGARLDYEDSDRGIKAFHVVVLRLTPRELDIFMTKYHRLLGNLADEYHFLPLFHGLIFYAASISRLRTNRQLMESDILNKIKILTKYGLKLDSLDLHGRSVLHYACWFKYYTVVEYLLLEGMKPDEVDSFGRGCLYYAISQPINGYACLSKAEHLVRTLETVVTSLGYLATGIVDSLGRSALHIACFESNRIALEYLLKTGFKIEVSDNQGKSPLDYASADFSDIIYKFRTKSQDAISRNQSLHSDITVLYSRQSYSKRNENEQDKLLTDTKEMDDYHMHSTGLEDKFSNTAAEDAHYRPVKGFPVTERSRNKTSEIFLNDPLFGVLKENDAAYIKKDIHHLIDKLAKELEEIEPRFLSKVQLGGSVSEGTKLKPPNEFDFQFHLMAISHCCVIDELKSNNDVSLAIAPSPDCYPLIKDLMQPDLSVNKALFDAFHSAVYKVIGKTLFWKGLPFYWHHHNLAVSAKHTTVFDKDKLTKPFRLKWVGLDDGDIDISVDLVPILVIDHLPDNVLAMIPDEIIEFVDKANFKWHVVCRDSDDGRLSFFPAEKYVLCRLMPELRQSYTLAKTISKYCCEVFGLDSDNITSYMFKNALFYELDPNTSFGLVTRQVMVFKPVNHYQTKVLLSMKETIESVIADTESFIQGWTLKIFDRLERWFSSGDGVHVYCRPSVTFPDIMVLEVDHENPHLKSLQKFKEILEK